jgi:hypothetical protein
VILRAHTNLTERQRIAVETEFGMQNSVLEVRMREALVPYFVRQLRIDRDANSSNGATLEWVNEQDLEPLITEAGSR